MADGPVAAMQPTAPAAAPAPAFMPSLPSVDSLTEDELHQIRECERIVRFRDEVLSGAHPRIKVPAHLVAFKSSSSDLRAVASTVAATDRALPVNNLHTDSATSYRATSTLTAHAPVSINGAQAVENLQSFRANGQRTAAGVNSSAKVNMAGLGPATSTASATEHSSQTAELVAKEFAPGPRAARFNPILLEKSDDLIKAEAQLQRQRLERALREQLDHHRSASKKSYSTEALADFDLKEVLMKALLLVQSTASQQTDANLAANSSGAETDSFDENTFYSSKHATPDSHQTSRILDQSEDVQMRESSHYEPPLDIDALPTPGPAEPAAGPIPPPHSASHPQTSLPQQQQQQQQHQNHAIAAETRTHASGNVRVPSSQHHIDSRNTHGEKGTSMETISSGDSAEVSRSGIPELLDDRRGPDHHLETSAQQLLEHALARHDNPILRAHNLSPVAPQPAHVSPLATARQAPVPQSGIGVAQGTPAQVAALRNDRSNGSSPDSSPQGRPAKKGKKKKRKSDRQMGNTVVASPYIKPEPRSPSPLSAPQLSRPTKRQRQSQRQEQGPSHDEIRLDRPGQALTQPGYGARVYRDERAELAQDSGNEYYAHQGLRLDATSEPVRYEQEYEGERPTRVRYVRRASPIVHPTQYAPDDVQIVGSISRTVVDHPFEWQPNQAVRLPSRASMRPHSDRDRGRSRSPVMGPPRLPATHIVVDEFGREYYAPPRPPATVIRHSVAPASTRGEPGVVYEQRQQSLRAASTIPGSGGYQERVIYRDAPAAYAGARRVVAQPEYAQSEYRTYRERDYPAAQPGEGFLEIRSPPDRTAWEEPRREYVRATTVRPVGRDEYVEVRGLPERGAWDEPRREYVPRATTARPVGPGEYIEVLGLPEGRGANEPIMYSSRATTVRAGEAVGYEAPQGYGARPSHTRSDAIPGDNDSGENRQGFTQPPARSYSVRPMNPPPQVIRRGYSVRPADPDVHGYMPREEEPPYIRGP